MSTPSIAALEARFWGAVNASVAHEMNNVLATIASKGGLQTDLIELARPDRLLDAARLAELARGIEARVDGGRSLTALLSRLAHSVDRDDASLDLGEELGVVAALTERAARLREVTIELRAPAAPISLRGRAFDLLHLGWRLIDLALVSAPAGSSLTLTAESDSDGVTIKATSAASADSAPSSAPGSPPASSPGSSLRSLRLLAEARGGRVDPAPGHELRLHLPFSMG